MILDELRVDFAMKRDHEMVIDLKSGLTREQLDSIEIQMLQGQRIPKLLPVEWIDIDGGITFRYSLSGKRMLLNRLQLQRMTMFNFYTLLLTVAEALDDCRHYMLRPEGFLLHEQYIFIGEHWDDAALAYVPLRDKQAVPSAGEAVLAMAIRWVGEIDEPDGIGLQQVFQQLRGEHVSWEKLRQTLLALLGANHRSSMAVTENEAAKIGEAFKEENVVSQLSHQPTMRHHRLPGEPAQDDRSANIHEYLPMEPDWRSSNPYGLEHPNTNMDSGIDLPLTEIQEQAAGTSRTGWIIGAGWVLATAIVWRFLYLAEPSQTNMLLASGLTLMAGAIGLILWRRMKDGAGGGTGGDLEAEPGAWNNGKMWQADDFVPNPIVPKSGSHDSAAGRMNGTSSESLQNPGPGIQQSSHNNSWQYSHQARPQEREPKQPGQPEVVPFKPSINKPMAANDATVLLGQESEGIGEERQPLSWLERKSNGQAERIRLEQLQFIIGRSNDGTHYIDQATGVSRAHIELLGSDGRWSAKDMGSRNGSTLNGSAMVPYKTYDLADTDELQLAGAQGPVYVFRAG